MEADEITAYGSSKIQHGPFNDRIYLMGLADEDTPDIITELDRLARSKGYGKIFAKVPAHALDDFIAASYVVEATIPGYYVGKEDCHLMSKYLDPERAKDKGRLKEEKVIEKALSVKPIKLPALNGYELRQCVKEDSKELARLYVQVFPTYPFPVHDPSFIESTMREGTIYFGAFCKGHLAAASSCETDEKSLSSEMTDFAADPTHRGKRLSYHLLAKMQDLLYGMGYHTVYTIARALSYPMNTAFARMGYRYAGTLRNNTNIAGKIESMNVWYKSLR